MKTLLQAFVVFLFLTCFGVSSIAAQVNTVSEQRVKTELEKRGISEEQMLKALAEKGIAVDDLNDLTPQQILELEAIVAELEVENRQGSDVKVDPIKKEEYLEEPTVKEQEELKESLEEVADIKTEELAEEIYGHNFFKNKDLSSFERASDVKAPFNYILGSGDKLVVSIWGLSQEELGFEIDQEGYIYSNKRRIFLKGLTIEKAKEKLNNWFSNYYRFRSGEFDVALSASRTININVQGEVANPGGYTISAINNAFNLLIAAEGPTRIGSLRDILLVKKGGPVVNLDFYSYLENPTNVKNASLEEGDVIVVPVAKKLVKISGGVKRPMIYEVRSNEPLSTVISFAGGFAQNARIDMVQVQRYTSSGLIIDDVSATQYDTYQLSDGDRIEVNTIAIEADNFVVAKGAFINEGTIEKGQGMKVSDLLEVAGIQNGAKKDLAFIKRTQEDGKIVYLKISIEDNSTDLNFELQSKDEVTLFMQSRYTDNQKFSISGAVRAPGDFGFALDQNINVKDAINLAGGLRRDASGYAIIHTVDPLNPKVKKYRRVNLVEAFVNENDFVISALDSLEIFSNALFDEASDVVISGAVNQEGRFQYGEGMTLGDVLSMSGGFKLAAATNRIEISRLQIQDNVPTKTVIANLEVDRDIMSEDENLNFELMPYDEIMVRYVPEFEFQKVISISGEVKFPGEYSLIKDNETIRDVIARAGGITDEAFPSAARLYRSEDDLGYIILKLDDVLKNAGSRFNFSLKDGDRIEIPKSIDFVSIVGATNARELYDDAIIGAQNQLNVPYHPGKDAKFYIDQYAGGIAENGSAKDIFVEGANGEITKTKNYFIYKNYPEVSEGSKIVVGYEDAKVLKEENEKEPIDWTEVLNDAVAQAVSVLTLILLIERI